MAGISGLHARNEPWQEWEEDYPKGQYVDWVKIILYPYMGDVNREYHLSRQRKIVERWCSMGKRLLFRANVRPWQDVTSFLSAWLPVLNDLKIYGDLVEIGNEPNHPGEGWGGSDIHVAHLFGVYWLTLAREIHFRIPGIQIGFPGLAVAQHDTEWMAECQTAIDEADFVCEHIYWQHNNRDDPNWGARYTTLSKYTRGKTVYISEYGDSTPGRSMLQKALQYTAWLRELHQRAPYYDIQAAFAYIASSPDPQWAEFEIDLDCAQYLKLEGL